MTQPLKGIKVADFSHVMAGPYASHLLTLLGADVIKIEEPTRGDAMRYYGNDRRYDGCAPAFIGVNAGKKSIALNLKDPQSLAAAKKIIETSDVVLENFRPGVMAKLGLGYEQVREIKEDIVYCSVSGYGQSGPRRDWPAIDNIVQATSGMMTLGGMLGDPPARIGFPVVDTLTGQTAALAILAALLRREREGVGDYIDVAMFDASLAFMTSAIVPYLVTDTPLERTGNTGYSGQPTSALFRAKDNREISLGVVQQHQFEILSSLLDRPDWLEDERFADPNARWENSDAMQSELGREFVKKDAEEWERLMSEAGIPCGMVRTVSEAVDLDLPEERKIKLGLHIEGLAEKENVEIVNAGFCMKNGGPEVKDAPPRLGENGADILRALGYPEEEISQILRK
ncbi:CaiB/BaiF CoA transferase family protein [Emcibacter sp.]|uniref:CaiB/BaiF CoA transferase family protein n=1 Tax=Emcibacter sp. TaxID=1979954 RepID=UPI003A9358EC